MDDGSAEQTTTFTALEDAVSKAKTVYDERFLRMELDSECIFRAWYADGTYYETDILQKLFLNGNVELSKSYAMGGTGIRAGEDTDNSKYYSNLSKSEALNAQNIMDNSKEVLNDVRLHGVYTAFAVDFKTGEVEYVSPSFKFKINLDTGDLDAIGQTYSFSDEVGRIVDEWLRNNNIILSDLQAISSTHTEEITGLQEITQEHTEEIEELRNRVTPIENGGTGASTAEEAIVNLGALSTPTQLWENASPTSSFAAQTIALDLTEYKQITIVFYHGDGNDATSSCYSESTCCLKNITYHHACVGSTNYETYATTYWRTFKFMDNGVYFASAYDHSNKNAENNAALIPYKIIGYR